MGKLYKFFKNYTLALSIAVLVPSILGLVLGMHLLAYADFVLDRQLTAPLNGGWDLLVTLLAAFGVLVGAWYVGEQLWSRRKFEKLLETDKRSEFQEHRKDLDDMAKRLPDRYKPRIGEKEASFKSARR